MSTNFRGLQAFRVTFAYILCVQVLLLYSFLYFKNLSYSWQSSVNNLIHTSEFSLNKFSVAGFSRNTMQTVNAERNNKS